MRRTLLALLAAMALGWLVLLAQAALTHYRSMDTNPGVRQLAQGLAGALAALDQPAEARALVHGMAHTLNAMRADVDLLQGSPVLLQLQDRAGQLLHSSTAGVHAVVLAGDAGHAAIDVAGTPHWVAWESTGPWRVVVAEPRLADARLLGFMGEDLAASVLLALPLASSSPSSPPPHAATNPNIAPTAMKRRILPPMSTTSWSARARWAVSGVSDGEGQR